MNCNTGKIFAVKMFNLTLPGIMEEESLKDIEVLQINYEFFEIILIFLIKRQNLKFSKNQT